MAAWGNASQRIKDFEASSGRKFTNNIHVLVKVSLNFHKVFGLALDFLEINPSFIYELLKPKDKKHFCGLLRIIPL